MPVADDRFLPPGNYAIINVGYNRPISFSEETESILISNEEYPWTVSFLANNKWTIQGPLDVFINMPPLAEDGEDVASVKNPPQPHQWVIKRHPGESQTYIIYSPSQPRLFWNLPDGDQGTNLQLSTDHDSGPSLWKFKKQTVEFETPDPIKQFPPGPVQRPTQLACTIQNTFVITVPAGWLTTITSISCGNCVNLVRIRRVVNGALEKQDFVSDWDASDRTMVVDESDSVSLAFPSSEEAYILVVETYHSKNREKREPRKLPGFKDLSTSLRVITASRPNDMKSFPDFQTFTIFDESLDAPGQGRTQNAIITIHTSTKVAVDLIDPGKPDPGRVNEGYNEELDRPRPNSMDQFLEKYHPIFVVDDSSSMTINGLWGKAKDAIFRVATEVMQYDSGGIDIYFLNSLLYREAITTPEEVVEIFGQIEPQGRSAIGPRLEFLLKKIIEQLEQGKSGAADYRKIKPINIVVLTDGPPSDDPMKVIRSAARKLNEGLHHANAVSIQFAYLGNETHAENTSKRLAEDPSVNIVDTVNLGTNFTPEALQKAILGAMHPSIRAKVASSSSLQYLYYRIYNQEGAIATKRPAYLDDSYLGRLRSEWVAPPYTAGSLRVFLSSMENVDARKTKLFANISSTSALVDDRPISLKIGDALGISPEWPLALVSGATPKDGLRAGTESLRVPPDSNSPIAPRLLYYGIYTEIGVSSSKAPLNEEKFWISQLDLNLIPPPHSVATLLRLISQRESVAQHSQLFIGKEAMGPLSNDHIITGRDRWPGSTVEDHVIFKTNSGCDGFPTGRFRVRAAGTEHYWTCHWLEPHSEGNSLCIWPLSNNSVAQVFYVNSAGNLCCDSGLKIDVVDNAIVLTRDRQRTEPWPNPWSHPLPRFLYDEESKTITVQFYSDPLISDRWPRPEREWKEKEFLLAARSVVATKNRSFEEIARWAPADAESTRQWTTHIQHGSGANTWHNLGVEENAIDMSRMAWEIESI